MIQIKVISGKTLYECVDSTNQFLASQDEQDIINIKCEYNSDWINPYQTVIILKTLVSYDIRQAFASNF